MITESLAYLEYKRIRNLAAFNVDSKAMRRKINQHMRRYTFPDGSILEIYKSGKALVPHAVIGQLRANTFGTIHKSQSTNG